jgi:hypothetical protein
MITNHRFFDGVPAAFYTRKVAEALGLQNIEPSSLSRSTLETLLNHADEIENFPATDDSYISKSVLLSKDLSSQLYSIYLEITEQFPSNDYIKFEQFLQIFLLAAYGVNGDDVVGGVLRFIPKLSVQLDHFAVGNIQEVLRALITGNRNYLQNNEYENDNNEFGLFRPTWSNIEGIVTKFKIFPPQSWQLFNRLSKKLRIADAVAGQLMCSLIPKSINIYGESVPLSGIGGPALTEYQDAAFTIYADTAVQPPVIVVRRKFKQELKKAA